jgi:hypothetical protein
MVSPQVVSDNIVCSLCQGKTRDANMRMIHLCSGAWEVVHKPRCVELSIVAEGAYENNVFRLKGFAAAMNDSQRRALVAAVCECPDKTHCPCGIKDLVSKVRPDLHGPNTQGENNLSAEKNDPPAPAAGTEITYAEFERKLQENHSKVMEACKTEISAAVKDLETKIEAKLDTTIKAAIEAAVPKPKPNGKGLGGAPGAANLTPGMPIDDAQRLNNIFAKKGSLKKAGLELAAAAKRMGSLTADLKVSDEEEAQ